MLTALSEEPIAIAESQEDKVDCQAPLDSIKLNNVGFQFPGTTRQVLEAVSLEIPMRKLVGIAGMSGAGKTTLVDLILGLLEPTSGEIQVNGEHLAASNLKKWQARLDYVPQAPFIADSSIAQNIAFGITEDEIDIERVRQVAEMAQISNYIETELPMSYETQVGERGARLSGGQRQRISIARALYHDPEVLIFDEATSALDGITEVKVIESIQTLSSKKTIIMIAHRLSTLKKANIIFLFDQGRLIEKGSHGHLMSVSPVFRQMAREDHHQDSSKLFDHDT